ncbi:hypothetical protein HY358_00440 [Candidatus Roizmanbacteria bacterium]|nr:hypothetical protein [Candidatus Roizmanbacteria bacterium]
MIDAKYTEDEINLAIEELKKKHPERANREKVNWNTTLISLGRFFTPIIYLSIWGIFLFLIAKNIPSLTLYSDTVLFLSFVIFTLALISKSSSWSIGHDKFGLKGDSRSRIINFHKGESGDFWFDLFADNPDLLKDKDVGQFVEKLTSNKNGGE